MCFLSYVSRYGVVDKILMVPSGLYYVETWHVSICPVMLLRAYACIRLLSYVAESLCVYPSAQLCCREHVCVSVCSVTLPRAYALSNITGQVDTHQATT
jgi:hypothetical protein